MVIISETPIFTVRGMLSGIVKACAQIYRQSGCPDKNEIERLIAGECIEKEISLELTYDELDKSIENLWSVLFTTGYLTHQGRTESGKYRLTIPNREIKNLFIKKIREWFSDVSRNDGKKLEEFSNAFLEKIRKN